MPRVHFVAKARKDNPAVKAGESYYWWRFRDGIKRYSADRPRQSRLTQSEFLGTMYTLSERIGDLDASQFESHEDLASEVEDIISEIRACGEEQQEKVYNMPDNLQYSPTAELLEGRGQSMEDWATNLETVTIEEHTDLDDAIAELQSMDYEGE